MLPTFFARFGNRQNPLSSTPGMRSLPCVVNEHSCHGDTFTPPYSISSGLPVLFCPTAVSQSLFHVPWSVAHPNSHNILLSWLTDYTPDFPTHRYLSFFPRTSIRIWMMATVCRRYALSSCHMLQSGHGVPSSSVPNPSFLHCKSRDPSGTVGQHLGFSDPSNYSSAFGLHGTNTMIYPPTGFLSLANHNPIVAV